MSKYLDMKTRPFEPVHFIRERRSTGTLAHRVGGVFARTFRILFGGRPT